MSTAITNWTAAERPREKFLEKGRSALTDAELLAILIGSGAEGVSALDLAREILHSVNSDLFNLSSLSVHELIKFKGIGEAKAVTLAAALELGRRRKERPIHEFQKLNSSKIIFEFARHLFDDLKHEEFYMLFMNNALKPLCIESIGKGGLTATIADPRIIFRSALQNNAVYMVAMHNHPSGNATPSESDVRLTKKILEIGKVLEVFLLDHLIFCGDRYYSFSDDGKLE